MSTNATLALANLIVQAALILAVFTGFYLAKTRQFRRHCLTIRIAVGVQILAIGIVMAPSLAGYLGNWGGFSWFIVEVIIHHLLGLVVLGLWIFINLAFTGVVRTPTRFKDFMRSALIAWLISLGLGIHLYIRIWA